MNNFVIAVQNTGSINKGCIYKLISIDNGTTTVESGGLPITCFSYVFQPLSFDVIGKNIFVSALKNKLFEIIGVEITKDSIFLKVKNGKRNVLVPIELTRYE